MEPWQGALIFVLGILSGFLNVMAGGGSLLTVPVMVFMGIPYAFRVGAMVSVDVLYRVVGARGKRVFDFVTSVAALTLVTVIIWWGWDYSTRGRVQTVSGLESISMFWAYLALPVGGLFCVPAILANFFDPQRNELENAQ